VLAAPIGADAQQSIPSAADAAPLPQLHWTSDAALGSVTLAGIAIGLALPVGHRAVPAQGLDRSGIAWGLDRAIIGDPSPAADHASDAFLLATLLAPPLLALATQPGAHGIGEVVRRPVVLHGESLLLTETFVQLLKPIASRPRPFTYLPAAQRPDDPSYQVTGDNAFVSMPWSAA
jgi:hypothetical protein